MTDVVGAGATPLPSDPDIEVEQIDGGWPSVVPPSPLALALVFAGGVGGTAAREALILAFPPLGGVPFAIFAINVTGAFLLGLLLESLARRGADHGRRRVLRLLLGTGALGGFTTYSALAADSAHLIGDGIAGVGVAYAVATVIVGLVATWAGISAGVLMNRRRGAAT